MSTTYDVETEKLYTVDQSDVEDWIEEQYGIPFNMATDLGPDASPNGEHKLHAKESLLTEYNEKKLKEFLGEHQDREFEKYETVSGTGLTPTFMCKLVEDGHIPAGTYVISFSY